MCDFQENEYINLRKAFERERERERLVCGECKNNNKVKGEEKERLGEGVLCVW